MTEASVSFAGNLTDDPQVRYTHGGIARAMFRVAVSGRREQEASFFTVIVWRDQAEHAAQSLSKGSRVVIVGRLQQRTWTAEDGSARSTVEVVAEELGPKPSMGNGHAGRGHQARRRIVTDTVTLADRLMRCPGMGGLPYRSGPVAFRSRGIRDTEYRLGRGGATTGGVRVCIARAWPLGPPWHGPYRLLLPDP
jgi:single-strand DNA-binding protein